MMSKKYLITSALPYANGPLHIGHLTGAYLPADIYVRWLRSKGHEVAFICGSDEHGAAITIRAKSEGVSPQNIVDKYNALLRDTFEEMGISFDIYHRTSSQLHHETAQDFFKTLYDKGVFIEKTEEQYYDRAADQFLADRYITGTCPKCSHEDAYGDQCENCGSTLSPTELINPKSTLSGDAPVLRKTKHWYLPLEQDATWLKDWIEEGVLDGKTLHNPKQWKPHVLGQCRSWIDTGLQPRAMTRDLSWGVDVPSEIKDSEGKKLYVWLDAPIGYISATKQWAKDTGKNWEDFWKNEDSTLVHFIGKDNIVFHCVIFPSILKAHGGYILPKNVPANQFMNLEGKKISTSRNWAIWVHEFVADFPQYKDVLRYYLTKNMPEMRDSEFTWKGFQEANNSELVGTFANFVHRVLSLINKYDGGKIASLDFNKSMNSAETLESPSTPHQEYNVLLNKVENIERALERFDFRAALQDVMKVAALGNQFLQFNEPWKLYKTDPKATQQILTMALQYVAVLNTLIEPFLPFTAARLEGLLASKQLDFISLRKNLENKVAIIPEGHQVNPSEHLFSKIEDSFVEEQLIKLENSLPKTPIFEEVKEDCSFEDFTKVDVRVGTIIAAQKVKKAKKLLQIQVDLGFEERTVVSGIAEHYIPEEIIGQQVLVVANLAPRKIRGIASQGMILMTENEEGKLVFVCPDEKVSNGTTVR